LSDNILAHKSENVPKSYDGKLFVKYLSPHVNTFFQPMDQAVTAPMKRGCLLQTHVDEGNDLKEPPFARCHK
jgi:hypothetical protein